MRDSSFDDSATHIKDLVQLGQYSELDSVASCIASLKQPDVDLEAHESQDGLENVLFLSLEKLDHFYPLKRERLKRHCLSSWHFGK